MVSNLILCVCFVMIILPIFTETSTNVKKTRCDKLDRKKIDFKKVLNYSSTFHMTYTSAYSHKCGKILLSAPARAQADVIFIYISSDNYALAKMIDDPDGISTISYNCDDDHVTIWQTLDYNFKIDDGYICLYSCSVNGSSLLRFNCLTLSGKVHQNIVERVLPKIERVSGSEKVIYSQQGCKPLKDCGLFNHL
ncbi:hypothetical protein CHUAL_005140 [Chamberlinius hualienensis]